MLILTITEGGIHVNCVVAKANGMLGLIKRKCKGLNDLKTLRTLYCSLVKSNLEYRSAVWSPYNLMLKKKYATTNTPKYSYFHRIANAKYFA